MVLHRHHRRSDQLSQADVGVQPASGLRRGQHDARHGPALIRLVRKSLLLAALLTTVQPSSAQSPPKLVVVVSFDQFRGDYPQRFAPVYPTKGGFRTLMANGAVFTACRYEHANNITGPGHATLLTGCYPARTGIVGNDFCDLASGKCGYCAQDSAGVFGARNMLVPTLGDVLRKISPRSKVVGVGLKDRAAILMAGPSATTCVWYDANARRWTSSAAYPQPSWLSSINATVNVDRYIGAVWSPLPLPSGLPVVPMDSVAEEGAFPGGNSAFPHRILDPSHPKFMASVLISPFSMEMLFDVVTEVVDRENLGRDKSPDVLCVGVSTTDYIGHVFGPDSWEVLDVYARADREIKDLLEHLNRRVGKNNYVLVVTSDHGVAPIPEVIRRQAEQQRTTIDAGRIREVEIQVRIDSALSTMLGPLAPNSSYVREIYEPSIYLNWNAIGKADRARVIETTTRAVASHPGIGIALSSDDVTQKRRPAAIDTATWNYIARSTFAGRTGEVVMYPKPYWIIGGNVATHGTPYDYDRWVPMMWYGAGIAPLTSDIKCAPVDIAPTLARLLGVRLGDADGRPLPLNTTTRR
ncbi:MAG: alkaline phosphatase family protein [Candidatus Kapabacteria bacterium]|nr:alkaline phosphatase family protein [Candidatus Kapabacteria bacterium]